MYQKFLLSGPLYLGSVHLIGLLNTIATVHSSSSIYAGDRQKINTTSFTKVGFNFKGPLITSIYALLLTTLTVTGLLSLATDIYTASYFVLLMLLFGVLFVALLTKFVEWSAIWNIGVVISILQEKQYGYIEIWVAAYISRGCRQRGFLLMFVFFTSRLVLRLDFLVVISIGSAFLLCLENVLKGVAFMVYYCDCKSMLLEKKIDLENGKEVANENVA